MAQQTQLENAAANELSTADLAARAAPYRTQLQDLRTEEMVLNMGPQHPSTHGVLRLELITDGEVIVDVVPHLGYMHRCFEKHAENLTYQQTIPFVDRLDYLASMCGSHIWAMGVERLCGIEGTLHPRVEYIRVLVSELNRIASHLLAIGTFGMDVGAWTPFLWAMRDREVIQELLEWASGSRLLYNYIWVGGLFYDLPVGFEPRAQEFLNYFEPRLDELDTLLTTSQIFIQRTVGIGVLPLQTALNYGCSGPVLRASGLAWDLRRQDGYSVYPELDFAVISGQSSIGVLGDVWNRYWVRVQEMRQSLRIARQCLQRLTTDLARTPRFDPRAGVPKRIKPVLPELYFRGETPRGEMGFYWVADPQREVPVRVRCRAPSFCNLSALPEMSRGMLVSDLVAVVGSIDIVLCEVDR